MAAKDQMWVVEDSSECEPEQENEAISTETNSDSPGKKSMEGMDDGQRLSETEIDRDTTPTNGIPTSASGSRHLQ